MTIEDDDSAPCDYSGDGHLKSVTSVPKKDKTNDAIWNARTSDKLGSNYNCGALLIREWAKVTLI